MKKSSKFTNFTNSICSTPAPLNKKRISLQLLNPTTQQFGQNQETQKKLQKKKTVTFFQIQKSKKNVNQSNVSESETRTVQTISQQSNSSKEQIVFMSSDIVKDMKELFSFLEFNDQEYLFKRIFKASQFNFDVAKFHSICDSIPNTLVIAQIQTGNIVGGFTPLPWADQYQRSKTHYKTDTYQRSFIFNFTTKEKYPLIKQINNKAIMGCKHLGPTFGGGYDFSIGNFANKKYTSSCDFPASYTKNPELKNIKLNRRSFIGTNQQIFLIKEWEVFQVIMKAEYGMNFARQKQFYDNILNDIHSSKEQKTRTNVWENIMAFFVNKQKQ